jgi:hypothetical protein
MERQKHVIQLSDHVRHKLDHYRPIVLFARGSNEYVPIDAARLVDVRRSDLTSNERQRRDVRLTPRSTPRRDVDDEPDQRRRCDRCQRLADQLRWEEQRLDRLNEENMRLRHRIRASIALNRHYEDEQQRMRTEFDRIQSRLIQHQIQLDRSNETIVSQTKSARRKVERDTHDNEQRTIVENLKRLRYEIQMYNRLVTSKNNDNDNDDDDERTTTSRKKSVAIDRLVV